GAGGELPTFDSFRKHAVKPATTLLIPNTDEIDEKFGLEGIQRREMPSLSINSYRLGRLISSSTAARLRLPLLRAEAASTICRSTASRALPSPWPSYPPYCERPRSFGVI